MDRVQIGTVGWAVALLCVAALVVLLAGALARHRTPLGPAGRITLVRAVLACGVAGLTAESLVGTNHTNHAAHADQAAHAALVTIIASIGLLLDAVDGRVARRTRTETPLGARFDMEVDAFLIAVLSLYVAPELGWWVLAIGGLRYGYVAVTWITPWLRRPLPPRFSAKAVAALQGVVLAAAASGLFPTVVMKVALAVALVLLVESFAHDVRTLWRERLEPLPSPSLAPVGIPPVPAGVISAAAFVGLWVALVLPDPTEGLTPGEVLRIPVEGLFLVAAALVLPARPRLWGAVGFGVLAGALVVLRSVNAGFAMVLDRPFDPLGDWGYFGSGVGVLGDSIGDGAARSAAVGLVLLMGVVLVALASAAVRVARVAADHRTRAARGVLALGLAWAVCFAASVQVAGGGPVAAAGATGLAVDTVEQVRDGVADQDEFADQIEADPFAEVPEDELLTELQGKDVLLVFVESYGRSATPGAP